MVVIPTIGEAASISLIKGNSGPVVRWNTSTVSYRLNSACSADVNVSTCLNEVRKAFKIWEPPTCSNLKFTEGALSNNLKLTAVGYNTNGVNDFAWIEGSAWQKGKFTLGVTSPVFYTTGPNAGSIIEADIAMNGYLQTWSTSGKNYSTDVMNVSVHEIGHMFGLQHNLYPNKSKPETMAPTADHFMGSRTPEADDIAGLCFLYPTGKGLSCASNKDCPYVVDNAPAGEFYAGQISCSSGVCNGPAAAVPSGQKKLGDACASDIDCGSPTYCQALSNSESVCSQPCNPTQSGSCPSGFTCYPYQGSTTKGGCLKTPSGGTTKLKELGDSCTASSQCKSQLCVNFGGKATCEQPCTSNSQCTTGQQCSQFAGKSYGACTKVSGGSTTPDKKSTGQACQGSSECSSNICVGSGGSGKCVADCASSSCPSGYNCLSLSSGKKGCFKGGSKKLGESCGSHDDCSTSLCGPSNGKYVCTVLCGSGQPTCPSGYQCFPVSGGASACFPAAKKAGDGESCEGSSDCVSGLCIGGGTLGTCVQPCSKDGQCASGYACYPLQGGGGACTKLGDKKIGDTCAKPSECATGKCVTLSGKTVCTATCQSTVDCPCGQECTEFSSGAKYCKAGKKVACVPNQGACGGNSECKSDLCINGSCATTCSIFWANSGCPAGKGCVRLKADKPMGVCSSKGPEGFGAACSNDTGCIGLFCHDGKCGQACNPFGPNSCPYGLVCEVAQGGVGSCKSASGGTGADVSSDSDAGSAPGSDAAITGQDGVAGSSGGGTSGGGNAGNGGSDSGMCSTHRTSSSGPATALALLMCLLFIATRRRAIS